MKLFSFCLLTLSFALVGFGLLNPEDSGRMNRFSNEETVPIFDCAKFEGEDLSLKLNNRLCEYMDRSVKQGVKPSKDKKGIQRMIRAGKLKLIQGNDGFVLDTFYYSYAALTPYAEKILLEIGSALDIDMYPPSNWTSISSKWLYPGNPQTQSKFKSAIKSRSLTSKISQASLIEIP